MPVPELRAESDTFTKLRVSGLAEQTRRGGFRIRLLDRRVRLAVIAPYPGKTGVGLAEKGKVQEGAGAGKTVFAPVTVSVMPYHDSAFTEVVGPKPKYANWFSDVVCA